MSHLWYSPQLFAFKVPSCGAGPTALRIPVDVRVSWSELVFQTRDYSVLCPWIPRLLEEMLGRCLLKGWEYTSVLYM